MQTLTLGGRYRSGWNPWVWEKFTLWGKSAYSGFRASNITWTCMSSLYHCILPSNLETLHATEHRLALCLTSDPPTITWYHWASTHLLPVQPEILKLIKFMVIQHNRCGHVMCHTLVACHSVPSCTTHNIFLVFLVVITDIICTIHHPSPSPIYLPVCVCG